jgi:hypothetical protein
MTMNDDMAKVVANAIIALVILIVVGLMVLTIWLG